MLRRPLITLALTAALVCPTVALARPDAVTLLPSGGSSIHFVVDVPPPVFARDTGDSTQTRFELTGYQNGGMAGAPALPIRVVTVAIPPAGTVSVRAQGIDPIASDGVLLTPVPTDLTPGSTATPPRDPRAYARTGTQRPVRARLLGVGWLRDQRVARVAIEPMDYDAAARRAFTVRQVDVTVDVAAAPTGLPPLKLDDAFDSVLEDVLVNPEQGRAWRRPAPGAPAPGAGLRASLRAAAAPVAGDTVFAHHKWVKIAVTQTGFYRLEYGQLRRLGEFNGLGGVPLDSVRLFTWPGFPVMPESSFCDSCGYREVAIQFVEKTPANGLFDDNSEYLYFRALGPSGWSNDYDPAFPDTAFIDNPYETHSYYYLTLATDLRPVGGAPRRIPIDVGAVVGGGTAPTDFPERVHHESDREYFSNPSPKIRNYGRPDVFWEKWFWQSLQLRQSFTLSDPNPEAPSVVGSDPYRLRLRLWGVNSLDGCAYVNGAQPPAHLVDWTLNGAPMPRIGWGTGFGSMSTMIVDTTMSGLQATNTVQLSDVVPDLALATPCVTPNYTPRFDQVAIAWIEFYYRRRFEAIGNRLAFSSEPGGGDWLFNIGRFTGPSPPRVFDVTDALSPVEILGASYTADTADTMYTLSFQRPDPGSHRYVVLPSDSILRVSSTDLGEPANPGPSDPDLRSTSQKAQVIIIYYDAFKTAADTLATWRRTHIPVDGGGQFDVVEVPVTAVYDQFSGGRMDPGGIRQFLRTAYYNWNGGNGGAAAPRFVTFLGDASSDFKDLRHVATGGFPATLIPTYENGYDDSPVIMRQFSTDDWMLNVNDPNDLLPDYFGGRVPAGDANAAMGYVHKLLAYERVAPFGTYRNRVMLVADDEMKGRLPDDLQWLHVQQTATLDANFTPQHFDRRYVYLHKYPLGTDLESRPGARDDIFKNVDDGVQIFNFVGHGSEFKITDEGVFLYSDPASLRNSDKPTAFISASCDVGKFDDPDLKGLGERLVVSPDGGAIGAISATEEALSGNNATLNQTIFRSLFARDTSGTGTGQYFVGLAQALLAGKLVGDVNSQKYELMGDAGVRLNLPHLWVAMTLWDSAGTTPVTQIQRGRTLTYRGEVRESPRSTAPLVPFDGTADLLIEDAKPRERTPPCRTDGLPPDTCLRYSYDYYAAAIYRGDVSIKDGRFEGRFVVPLEAAAGPRSRVRAYVQGRYGSGSPLAGGSTDGVGSFYSSVTPGSPPAGDTEGPRISLSFTGGSTSVRPDAVLQVVLTDPSGILTTAHTPQNGIVATIDDNTTTRIDITESFRYAADSYQNGTATLQLPNLAHGPHTVEVSAADNLALGLAAGLHRSSARLAFEVVDTPPLSIARTYLFPSPTRSGGPGSGGTFVIDAPGDSINVLLRIYTVSGRLIRTLTSPGGLGQVQIPWDGMDAEGDALANGVYFYKTYVYAREADGTSSARQNAFADGRFVIVNRR